MQADRASRAGIARKVAKPQRYRAPLRGERQRIPSEPPVDVSNHRQHQRPTEAIDAEMPVNVAGQIERPVSAPNASVAERKVFTTPPLPKRWSLNYDEVYQCQRPLPTNEGVPKA